MISREDEAGFPNFKTVVEAKQYFRKRYGESYREGNPERLDEDHVCYFDEVDYQPVQISVFSDGSVSIHVVYWKKWGKKIQTITSVSFLKKGEIIKYFVL